MKRLLIIMVVLAALAGGIVGANMLTRDIEGTIVYEELEGGLWLIEGKDGELFWPIALDEDLKVQGLRVKVRVVEQDDIVSIGMRGKPVEIIKVLD